MDDGLMIDKREPLSPPPLPNTPGRTTATSLNDRLNTDYVDVGPDEYSIGAKTTKAITTTVGKFVKPRQLLVLLRVLKAITFCFLILTVAADIMYIAFLDILADKEVKKIVGGPRDTIIRIYGLFLAAIAIAIELDITKVVKSFGGFKGFIPRAFLLFFISAITGAHPLHNVQVVKIDDDDNNTNGGDDDYQYYGGDDYYINDDYYSNSVNADIPKSAVVFQMVTSFILYVLHNTNSLLAFCFLSHLYVSLRVYII